MKRMLLFFSLMVINYGLLFAEEITITTYYPSPYGSYNALFTDKLGVGDNNNDGLFTAADVPTTTGEAWIRSMLGIAKTNPDYELDVAGVANADVYYVGGTPGLNQTINVRNSAGSGSCSITVSGGIITGTTC